jgi:hypothetical protein
MADHSNVQLADGAAYRVPMEPEELVNALRQLAPGEFLKVEYGKHASPWWLNPAAIQRIERL